MLTDMEKQVLKLASEGHNTRAIADLLMVSPHTVKDAFGRIYRKLGVHKRPAAVFKAIKFGFIT